jgi:hypothetical protein
MQFHHIGGLLSELWVVRMRLSFLARKDPCLCRSTGGLSYKRTSSFALKLMYLNPLENYLFFSKICLNNLGLDYLSNY